MNKYLYLTAPLFLLIAFITSAVLVRNRLDTVFPVSRYAPLVQILPRSFRPRSDNLNIVIIQARNPQLIDVMDYAFTLRDAVTTEVVRQIPFSGRNIGYSSDLRFQFAPIPDSSRRDLVADVTPATSSSIIQIEVDPQNQLSFRSYYRSPRFVTHVRSIITSDPFFFVLWLLLLFTLSPLFGRFRTLGGHKPS